MSIIKFIMAARCEAAGRPNNEDNFQLTDNLADDQWSFVTDSEVELSEKGALLIVCDGMGGANAGEVASQLAVETVKEWFSSERLTEEVLANSESITRYIKKAIVAADLRIKEEGKADKNKEGMGTTIVLAWVIGQSVFVGWCGDSRAYCFHPATGLQRFSHDHSFVQSLVDMGQLSDELAFNHPNGNIITRSLGDPLQEAQPEVKEYPLHNDDVIMLCSDGLNGVLRDSAIEEVMRENAENMSACRDALWEAARNANWYDNVTIGLCRIVTGGSEQDANPPATPTEMSTETPTETPTPPQEPAKKGKWKSIACLVVGLILGILAGIVIAKHFNF